VLVLEQPLTRAVPAITMAAMVVCDGFMLFSLANV
jgi:hypothetical protein